jgi:hypothetical protein
MPKKGIVPVFMTLFLPLKVLNLGFQLSEVLDLGIEEAAEHVFRELFGHAENHSVPAGQEAFKLVDAAATEAEEILHAVVLRPFDFNAELLVQQVQNLPTFQELALTCSSFGSNADATSRFALCDAVNCGGKLGVQRAEPRT